MATLLKQISPTQRTASGIGCLSFRECTLRERARRRLLSYWIASLTLVSLTDVSKPAQKRVELRGEVAICGKIYPAQRISERRVAAHPRGDPAGNFYIHFMRSCLVAQTPFETGSCTN